jgi:hypothetical protein
MKKYNILNEFFDDKVDEWHNSTEDIEIHDFLNLTEGEYKKILTSSDQVILKKVWYNFHGNV